MTNNVTSIGWSVFSGCSSLKTIEIPSSVTTIGWAAFSGCDKLDKNCIPDKLYDDFIFN